MKRLVGGIAIAVSLGLGVTPALAAGVLSPARVISRKPVPVAEPALTVSGNGRALAAWDVVERTIRNDVQTWHGPIQARLGRIGGRWGAVQTLSAVGKSPVAALGKDGTAALGWTAEERPGRAGLRLSIAPPGRPFGRSIGITTGRSFGVLDGVEVLPDDRVVVVWSRAVETEGVTDRRLLSVIEYSVFTPDGHRRRSGVIAATTEGGELQAKPVTVAQTSSGSVAVAFPPLLAESSTELLAVLPAGASRGSERRRAFIRGVSSRSLVPIRRLTSGNMGNGHLVSCGSDQFGKTGRRPGRALARGGLVQRSGCTLS
jgi:hypothetical protein